MEFAVIEYMLAHGYVELSPTTRYRRFKPSKFINQGEPDRTYFVGKLGAVKCSKTGSITDAFSVTDIFDMYVKLWQLTTERERNEDSSDSIS